MAMFWNHPGVVISINFSIHRSVKNTVLDCISAWLSTIALVFVLMETQKPLGPPLHWIQFFLGIICEMKEPESALQWAVT